jgi:hypothetical protein
LVTDAPAVSLDATDIKEGTHSAGTPISEAMELEEDKEERVSVAAVGYVERVDEENRKSSSPPESKDWIDLTMQEKLEALHTVAEWQFDNPHRLRQQMKDDGDNGHWVCLRPVQPKRC